MMAIDATLLGILAVLALLVAAWWGIRRRRQSRVVEGAVRSLKESVRPIDPDVAQKRAEQEESDLRRPSIYGVPALAVTLTSLVIVVALVLLFAENIFPPYPVPKVGHSYRFTYRAPAEFIWQGQRIPHRAVLLNAGVRATTAQRQKIEAALAHRTQVNTWVVVGCGLLITMFFLMLLYHMNIVFPRSTEKNKHLMLVYLAMMLMLLLAKAAIFYDLFSPYLLPIPWAGMLITIFLNRRIVPLTMLMTCILVGLEAGLDMQLFFVLLAGGLVSGTWIRAARHRNEVMLAGLGVGIVMCLAWVSIDLINPRGEIVWQSLASPILSGLLSGLLLMITLPLFEAVFDLASSFRLMELLDLNTPLLKKLFFAAPGTYQHSMAVANIAEMVALQIGANDLLVRVGSYYHDVGKMFSPEYFIENQDGGPNPHDDIGPVASAAAIRSHVILGLQLGRRVGLPSAVLDFIAEHHGTSTIDYFFNKARSLDSGIRSERIFKYPGPKPRCKETAIVMLVDSAEAAARTLEKKDEESVQKLLDGIVQRKLDQGQLDNSGLTVGELNQISRTLVHILKSAGHQRIDYPSPLAAGQEKQGFRVLRGKKK